MGLLTKYKDEGYALCNVGNTTNMDQKNLILDFTYIIQKGVKARITRIDITGNEGTRDWTIRRELRVYEGDMFNETQMKRSEARIRRLGFFEEVEIVPRQATPIGNPDGAGQERQTGAFSIGAGFSSVENFCSGRSASRTSWDADSRYDWK